MIFFDEDVGFVRSCFSVIREILIPDIVVSTSLLGYYTVSTDKCFFDVHRAMHRNIISIVKPTRYTNVSNLFYFGMTLYIFRTLFPSIISSSRLYIQQPNTHCCLLASGYPLASRQQCVFDKCLLLCVQSWTPDDWLKDRPKHVECHSKRK